MLLPLCALAGEISGSYVGEGKDFIVAFQILPAGQGRVMGDCAPLRLMKRASSESTTAPLRRGEWGNRLLETSWDNGGDVAISGNLSGGYLLVSAANGLKVALRPPMYRRDPSAPSRCEIQLIVSVRPSRS